MANFINPLENPLLSDVERLSPATELCLIVGYDSDGWDIRESFSVGDVVLSKSDLMWRIVGFTLDDLVLVAPHGLGHDSAVRLMAFRASGLRYPKKVETFIHRDSLI